MKYSSALASVFCLSFVSLTSLPAQAAEPSMCQGDCANSPIPIDDVLSLSRFSSFVTKEQLVAATKNLVVDVPQGKDDELVTVPLIISSEAFDPKKHTPKKTKAGTFDESPESALFLNFTMPTLHSTATEGRNRIEGGSSVSNSMLHRVELERNDGGKRVQKLDGIGKTDYVTVEKGVKQFSVTMTYREWMLISEPKSLFAFEEFASDASIEKVHDLMGYSDPYDRRKTGMNKAETEIIDPSGKSLEIKPNKKYVLPLLVQLKRFDNIEALSSADGRSETTVVTGVRASVPMSSTFSQGGVGTEAALIHNRELRQGLVATVAASMAVNIQKTFGDGYQPFDKPTKVTWGGDISAGLTCNRNDGSATTATLFITADSAPLSAKDYKSPSGPFLQRQSQAATTEKDLAVGLSVSHKSAKGLAVRVGVKEDFGGSQRKARAIGGNNNRDIQYWATVSQEF